MELNNDNKIIYWGNIIPRCPWCDKDIDIQEHELYELYSEDAHEIECPYCEKDVRVCTHVKFTFSTDEQE